MAQQTGIVSYPPLFADSHGPPLGSTNPDFLTRFYVAIRKKDGSNVMYNGLELVHELEDDSVTVIRAVYYGSLLPALSEGEEIIFKDNALQTVRKGYAVASSGNRYDTSTETSGPLTIKEIKQKFTPREYTGFSTTTLTRWPKVDADIPTKKLPPSANYAFGGIVHGTDTNLNDKGLERLRNTLRQIAGLTSIPPGPLSDEDTDLAIATGFRYQTGFIKNGPQRVLNDSSEMSYYEKGMRAVGGALNGAWKGDKKRAREFDIDFSDLDNNSQTSSSFDGLPNAVASMYINSGVYGFSAVARAIENGLMTDKVATDELKKGSVKLGAVYLACSAYNAMGSVSNVLPGSFSEVVWFFITSVSNLMMDLISRGVAKAQYDMVLGQYASMITVAFCGFAAFAVGGLKLYKFYRDELHNSIVFTSITAAIVILCGGAIKVGVSALSMVLGSVWGIFQTAFAAMAVVPVGLGFMADVLVKGILVPLLSLLVNRFRHNPSQVYGSIEVTWTATEKEKEEELVRAAREGTLPPQETTEGTVAMLYKLGKANYPTLVAVVLCDLLADCVLKNTGEQPGMFMRFLEYLQDNTWIGKLFPDVDIMDELSYYRGFTKKDGMDIPMGRREKTIRFNTALEAMLETAKGPLFENLTQSMAGIVVGGAILYGGATLAAAVGVGIAAAGTATMTGVGGYGGYWMGWLAEKTVTAIGWKFFSFVASQLAYWGYKFIKTQTSSRHHGAAVKIGLAAGATVAVGLGSAFLWDRGVGDFDFTWVHQSALIFAVNSAVELILGKNRDLTTHSVLSQNLSRLLGFLLNIQNHDGRIKWTEVHGYSKIIINMVCNWDRLDRAGKRSPLTGPKRTKGITIVDNQFGGPEELEKGRAILFRFIKHDVSQLSDIMARLDRLGAIETDQIDNLRESIQEAEADLKTYNQNLTQAQRAGLEDVTAITAEIDQITIAIQNKKIIIDSKGDTKDVYTKMADVIRPYQNMIIGAIQSNGPDGDEQIMKEMTWTRYQLEIGVVMATIETQLKSVTMDLQSRAIEVPTIVLNAPTEEERRLLEFTNRIQANEPTETEKAQLEFDRAKIQEQIDLGYKELGEKLKESVRQMPLSKQIEKTAAKMAKSVAGVITAPVRVALRSFEHARVIYRWTPCFRLQADLASMDSEDLTEYLDKYIREKLTVTFMTKFIQQNFKNFRNPAQALSSSDMAFRLLKWKNGEKEPYVVNEYAMTKMSDWFVSMIKDSLDVGWWTVQHGDRPDFPIQAMLLALVALFYSRRNGGNYYYEPEFIRTHAIAMNITDRDMDDDLFSFFLLYPDSAIPPEVAASIGQSVPNSWSMWGNYLFPNYDLKRTEKDISNAKQDEKLVNSQGGRGNETEQVLVQKRLKFDQVENRGKGAVPGQYMSSETVTERKYKLIEGDYGML